VKVLVVEDEIGIQQILAQGLVDDGHTVRTAISGEEAVAICTQEKFDAFLLDVSLPGMSGNDLCLWLRERGSKEPILMVTARASLEEKLAGLDSGADDYLTKPFEMAEVRARLRAFQRKQQGYPRTPISVGDLVIDPNARTVVRGGKALELSKKEFALLEFLARNRDRVVTRAMIAQAVWDSETNLYTNVIDVFVAYLRKKVDAPGARRLIHTVRGKGFVLSETEPVKVERQSDPPDTPGQENQP